MFQRHGFGYIFEIKSRLEFHTLFNYRRRNEHNTRLSDRTASQDLLLPESLTTSCHSQFSYCLNFLHTGEIQSPRRPGRTQENQFLSSQLFANQTAHMIDQKVALATYLLLILERESRSTDHIKRMDSDRISRKPSQFSREQTSGRSISKVKAVFLLEHSLLLTCRSCFRSTNSWLNQQTHTPRLSTFDGMIFGSTPLPLA